MTKESCRCLCVLSCAASPVGFVKILPQTCLGCMSHHPPWQTICTHRMYGNRRVTQAATSRVLHQECLPRYDLACSKRTRALSMSMSREHCRIHSEDRSMPCKLFVRRILFVGVQRTKLAKCANSRALRNHNSLRLWTGVMSYTGRMSAFQKAPPFESIEFAKRPLQHVAPRQNITTAVYGPGRCRPQIHLLGQSKYRCRMHGHDVVYGLFRPSCDNAVVVPECRSL
jgi:hypothetical protein